MDIQYIYVGTVYLCIVFVSARNKLYICIVEREDHLVRKDGSQFTVEDYNKHPQCYNSVFDTKVCFIYIILIGSIVVHW